MLSSALMVRHEFPSGMAVVFDDVVADEPASRAADEHIGGEVFLTEDAGDSHSRGRRVERKLSPVRRVLGGER